MDRKLCRIKIENAVPVDHLSAECIIVSDLVDLASCIFSQPCHHIKRGLAPQDQISSGNVQTGQEQIRAAGRLGQVNDLTHIPRLHPLADEKKRALSQTPAGFVHTDRCNICPCLHGGYGQIFPKIKMCPVCLVGQHFHSVFMRHFNDRPQIGTDPVVGRIIDQYCNCIRVLTDRFLHVRAPHSKRNAEPFVHIRIHIDWLRTAKYKCIDRTSVYIPGHNDLIPFFTAGQDHGLHGGSRSAHHKKCMLCAKRLGRKILRFFDHRHGMTQIVQRLHGIHVNADALLAQQLDQFRIPPSVFVSRYVKGYHAVSAKPLQRLINGRPLLR